MVYLQKDLEDDEHIEQAEYEGEWKANKRHGKGRMRWSDGSEFEGDWYNDKRTKGRQSLKDGKMYIGEFRNDMFHGKGDLRIDQKRVYTGIFREGTASSFGKITYTETKDSYIGQLR